MNDRAFRTAVVLLLAGIFATLAFVALQPAIRERQRRIQLAQWMEADRLLAQRTKAEVDISTIDGVLEHYRLDTGSYPTAAEGLRALVRNPGSYRWNGPYLKSDPPMDPWGGQYTYRTPGHHGADYDVFSAGPDRTPNTNDDIGTWNTNL